jgi:hypothetical protein
MKYLGGRRLQATLRYFRGPWQAHWSRRPNLRRMGQKQRAQQTLFYTLLLCIAFLVPFLPTIPAGAPIKKLILFAVEGAGYTVFPSLVREDYVKGKAAHPGVKPRSGLSAIGWGVLGLPVYVALAQLILVLRLDLF